ncbi:phosphate-starvation-inducible PsiE family protein [Lyngbya confervoides]|uniref:Phosphate-starvation-inducible PsiE family protein n=1 Tax=Lyngbya confervoides BDU141951 TaxID=1574623 RepID=A0ABD4T6U5_9CYAN|nr:phosphate-starvation-inducible PsiE family protein [Lyngbya confervoides]MCM1984284.1 phosphate-starvation-inducible PsiE family protein [Lyngbya confervoides BDU141951]
MTRSRKLKVKLSHLWRDSSFLSLIHGLENCVSKILSVALVLVIAVSIFDLILILVNDLFTGDRVGFFNRTLIEIFGLFLNILIALELLENITAYLKKHILHVELVVTTAIIAVARKIVIFDPKEYSKTDLIALAFAIFALSVSYWLIRMMNRNQSS